MATQQATTPPNLSNVVPLRAPKALPAPKLISERSPTEAVLLVMISLMPAKDRTKLYRQMRKIADGEGDLGVYPSGAAHLVWDAGSHAPAKRRSR